MKAWLGRISTPLLCAGLAIFFWPVIRTILIDFFEVEPPAFLARLFSTPWYYFLALAVTLWVGAAVAWNHSPARDAEVEIERRRKLDYQAQTDLWNSFYRAFYNGVASEYPIMDASRYGYFVRPGEVCYLLTQMAILGRGNAHQLEISQQSNAGLDLKGIKLGQATDRKDSYATIQYDETHPGTLVVSNQRLSFISAPSVFLEVKPEQIVSVAWLGQYVMIRTSLNADDGKNLVAIRIAGEMPSWLFASAIFRLATDNPVHTS
jgi:hypothetical protein